MNKQEYLLTCLSEECGEISQRVSKILRFGLTEIQPSQELTNSQRLINELNDLLGVIQLLEIEKILPRVECLEKQADKKDKVKKYMQISRDVGSLKDG